MDNKVGNYIKNYRGKQSLREFAKKCDISHTHLDSIEKGFDPRTGKPVRITVDTLSKIAKAMNMTINELLINCGEVDENSENVNVIKNVDLDDNYKLDKIIIEKTKTLSEEDKKKIIDIIDVINKNI